MQMALISERGAPGLLGAVRHQQRQYCNNHYAKRMQINRCVIKMQYHMHPHSGGISLI